jgi:Tfp pilus assembly protein PilN
MKTEQDIRRFMQENRIPVPKDGAFMEELMRQINLLPTPASLTAREARIQENMRMLTAVMEAVRKHNRKQLLLLALVNVIICIPIFCAGYFFITPQFLTGDSMIIALILQWRHALLGFICLAAIGATVSQADIIRI